ncbi:MAG: hypothetical protein DHS20C16_03370 [Phycisphaerae bacterium]|nr:MAG: hypothetical protein DHS20C16_03370 [Phycisphaerae bacterium]
MRERIKRLQDQVQHHLDHLNDIARQLDDGRPTAEQWKEIRVHKARMLEITELVSELTRGSK